jgi:hypothetical protein
MYTDQDYENDKSFMTKQERFNQERFEKIIDVLIMYKQQFPDKEVSLSDRSINESVKWFQENMKGMIDNLSK